MLMAAKRLKDTATGIAAVPVTTDGTARPGDVTGYAPLSSLVGADGVAIGTVGNPLVTTSAGTVDQDVNLVGINGVAPVTGSGTATAALRVELPTNGTGVVGLAAGSATIGALTANQSVNVAQMNAVTVLMGNGASGTGAQRVTLASDSTGTINVRNVSTVGYETVAASATAQVLGGSGATGDYLAAILVIPTTVSPGVVTLLDNATSIPVFVGGASSLSNLAPFTIYIGSNSASGPWKLTTGAGLSCFCTGNFSA